MLRRKPVPLLFGRSRIKGSGFGRSCLINLFNVLTSTTIPKKKFVKKKNLPEPGPISNRLRVPETVTLTRAGKLPFLLVQLSLSGLLLCVISLNLNIRKLMLFQDNKWCEHTVGGAPTLSEMAMALKLLCTPLNRPSPSYKTKVKYVLVWRLRKRWI